MFIYEISVVGVMGCVEFFLFLVFPILSLLGIRVLLDNGILPFVYALLCAHDVLQARSDSFRDFPVCVCVCVCCVVC